MDLSGLSVRALKPEYQTVVGFELVLEKTKNNGVDEAFFEHQGTKYVAYDTDDLDISEIKKIQSEALWKGHTVQVLHTDNEVNHWSEKALNTSWNVISAAVPDAIGGGAAAAIVSKIGLGGKHMKIAVAAGAITSFFKEAISVAIADVSSYGKADLKSLERFLVSASNTPISSTTVPAPLKALPSSVNKSSSLLLGAHTQVLGVNGLFKPGLGHIAVAGEE